MFKSNSHMKGALVGIKSITGILCYKHIIRLLCWASVALRKRSKLISKAMKGPADFPTWTWLLQPLLILSSRETKSMAVGQQCSYSPCFPLGYPSWGTPPLSASIAHAVSLLQSSLLFQNVLPETPNMSMTLWITVWPGNCSSVLLLMHLFCPSVWAWVV